MEDEIDNIGTKLLGSWEIPDNIDADDFDFTWEPSPLDPPYIHQFGTQHQKTGGPRYHVPGATAVKYNSTQRVTKLADPDPQLWEVLLPDLEVDWSWHPDDTEHPYIYVFGVGRKTSIERPAVRYRMPGATSYKYMNIDVVKFDMNKFMRRWHIPKNIDVSGFDFLWEPSPLDPPYIYQFGTQHQRTGGPRYTARNAKNIKYVCDQRVTRLENSTNWELLVPDLDVDMSWHPDDNDPPYIYLFGADKKSSFEHPVVKYTVPGATTQKFMNTNIAHYRPLDVVFMSNGETCADENWEKLVELLKDKPNRLVRSDRVSGRTASQHAAAQLSTTSWYFLVPAKLEVNPQFDWSWQPDRSQMPKHYVFTATNPVNQLEYGHQAMIGQHRELTLHTTGNKLDFTMESPLRVLDINSGIARYDTSEYETWRTAFREAIKLMARVAQYPQDAESQYRLHVWQTTGNGTWGATSIRGALDGCQYYSAVNGDHDSLMLSSDWAWCAQMWQNINKNNK